MSMHVRKIFHAIIVATLLLGTSSVLTFLSPDYISTDLAHRLLGVMLGCLVIFYSNSIPKVLVPLAALRCDPVKEQSIRRFTGWSLVVGGWAYSVAWIAAPMAIAYWLSACLLGTALLVVILRTIWVTKGNSGR